MYIVQALYNFMHTQPLDTGGFHPLQYQLPQNDPSKCCFQLLLAMVTSKSNSRGLK